MRRASQGRARSKRRRASRPGRGWGYGTVARSQGHFYHGERNFVPLMHEEVLALWTWRRLTWEDLVIRALQGLGGEAHLSDLYEVVARHPKTGTNPTWKATVRRTLQQAALPVEKGVWRTPRLFSGGAARTVKNIWAGAHHNRGKGGGEST